MKDIEIVMKNEPGQLALMGEVLGKAGISLEGGGVFNIGEYSVGHFLIEEADKAKIVLEKAGFEVRQIDDVIVQKLRQDIPGQLGLFCRQLADANINILTQYSDHANQLIVVVDKYQEAKQISEQWMKKWWNKEDHNS